jgi:hypothetical protein
MLVLGMNLQQSVSMHVLRGPVEITAEYLRLRLVWDGPLIQNSSPDSVSSY